MRIDERGLIRCHLLTGLFDREALLRDLLRQRIDRCLRRRDICARLVQRRLVVPRVDASNDLARLDGLVVVDRNVGDVARYFRADHRRVHVDISVVGRNEIPARGPVVTAVFGGAENGCRDREDQHRLL
jgi:hypothetical protein